MDEHESKSESPYPPPATGAELLMLKGFAALGIILLAAGVSTMGLCMYLLPGAPPQVPLPLF